MLHTVLVDAGPLIALFDKDDQFHQTMLDFIRAKKYKFVTTLAVITEASHMLDFSVDVQMMLMQWVMQDGVIIQDITQADFYRVIALSKKYRDIPMDFADATLVIAAEKTGVRNIISVDSDFDTDRLPGKVKIQNIFKR